MHLNEKYRHLYYIQGRKVLGKFRKVEAHFSCGRAANLPGLLPLEPAYGGEEMRRRNIEVKFRLSEAEYVELTEKVKRSGLNRNAFLIRMIRQQTIYPADHLRDLNHQMDILLAQIRGMATNLNQVAKIANARKEVPCLQYLETLLKGMRKFSAAMQPVWEGIREALYGNR